MPLTQPQLDAIEETTQAMTGHMNAIRAALNYVEAIIAIDQRPENADGSHLPQPMASINVAKQHALEAARDLVTLLE